MIETRQRSRFAQCRIDVQIAAERALRDLRARLQSDGPRLHRQARRTAAEAIGRIVQHQVELLLADDYAARGTGLDLARIVLVDDAFCLLDVLRRELDAARD